jgi:hypothetical protein
VPINAPTWVLVFIHGEEANKPNIYAVPMTEFKEKCDFNFKKGLSLGFPDEFAEATSPSLLTLLYTDNSPHQLPTLRPCLLVCTRVGAA